MKASLSERACALAGHCPSDWEQIDDDREVERVLGRLRDTTRTAVYECPELYELAYPGYPGDREYYLSKTQAGDVLYLGVGTGRIFLPMAAQNPHALGVESSSDMCRVLSAGNCASTLACCNAMPPRHHLRPRASIQSWHRILFCRSSDVNISNRYSPKFMAGLSPVAGSCPTRFPPMPFPSAELDSKPAFARSAGKRGSRSTFSTTIWPNPCRN